MRITVVEPRSPADRLGFRVGDDIVALNGDRVRDELDLEFHVADERVTFRVERGAGAERRAREVVYRRGRLDGPFGIQIEEPKVRLCGNDCVFCFVDQSPAGMRKTVYVRDEDYRLSFLYGNFVTLTNLKEWELRRILSLRLSPLYVSVHSLDPEIRERLFAQKRAREILPVLDRLIDGGIEVHTQVVYCPGFNDGPDLERTIEGLASRIERGVQSLAIVPVGLTDHREGLPRLDPVDADTAREVAATVRPWERRLRSRHGRGFVYLADEWYRLLDEEVPGVAHYDGFPQLEDGIGLTRHFLHEMELEGERIVRSLAGSGLRNVTVVTGELFAPTLAAEMARLSPAAPELRVTTTAVPNAFFGPSVTVAGLLAGRDIGDRLEGRELGDRVSVPPVSVNAEGRFIDDVSLDDLAERLGVPVVAGFGVGVAA